MSYQWKVGELAKCIDATGEGAGLLKKGAIYPVKEFMQRHSVDPSDGREWAQDHVRLCGVPNPPSRYGIKSTAWWAARFRPLDDSDLEAIREKYKDEVPTAPKVRTE